MPVARLTLRNVRKTFGEAVALDDVTFSVERGQVHALIGENGAGKSTLMNVLAGATPFDSGELFLDGVAYRPSSPADARRAGVAMVHQELSLCPHLTVAENIVLGAEPTRFGFVRRADAASIAATALARVVDRNEEGGPSPEALVGDLSPGDQQIVEIARALSQSSARVLILDEPTSSLGSRDVARLFSVVRALRAKEMAIVYISHFLEEVREVADAFTVLRDGATVGTGRARDAPIADIVSMMAGRAVSELFPRSPRTPGDVVLEVRGLEGTTKPRDASLDLRRGEVVGIAGLVGAGRTELARAIFGLDPVKRGIVKVLGVVGPSSPSARVRGGMGFVSEDRKGEGLAMGLSIADNVTLSKLDGLGPFGLVLPSRARAVTRHWMARLGIHASGPDQRIGDLSGGNQQKAALARLLYGEADILLLDEPTRGIDVASKAQIYELIDALASSGKAILVISSYLPELFGICDRIAVMRRGILGPARAVGDLTEHGVLMEATGS